MIGGCRSQIPLDTGRVTKSADDIEEVDRVAELGKFKRFLLYRHAVETKPKEMNSGPLSSPSGYAKLGL